jgi:hypothetical protein
MKTNRWLTAACATGLLVTASTTVWAQSSLRYLGQAVGGQRVSVDLNSINRVSPRSVDFTYYLGNDQRYSQANCEDGTWTTFEDGVVHQPQSGTTSEMIRLVCNGDHGTANNQAEHWFVFAPPSNVRTAPNGDLQCTIRSARQINVYSWTGDWAVTDACGSRGYIHSSQIEHVD